MASEKRPDNWLSDPRSTPLTEPELRFIDWLCDQAVDEWMAKQVVQTPVATAAKAPNEPGTTPSSRP
jgi:hypothetical protein